jgi:hypothetical protein
MALPIIKGYSWFSPHNKLNINTVVTVKEASAPLKASIDVHERCVGALEQINPVPNQSGRLSDEVPQSIQVLLELGNGNYAILKYGTVTKVCSSFGIMTLLTKQMTVPIQTPPLAEDA